MRLAVTLTAGAFAAALSTRAAAGVFVEEVPLGFGGECAGLAVGDVLESWSRAAHPPANPHPAHGAIRTPFDVLHVDVEQGPRGTVTLSGRRDGKRMHWTMPMDEWRLGVKPDLPRDLSEMDERAKQHMADAKPAEAIASWEQAASVAEQGGDRRVAAWFLQRSGGALARAREWTRVDDVSARAVALLEAEQRPAETSAALYAWAQLNVPGTRKERQQRYERCLRLEEEIDPQSLAAARVMRVLGDAHYGETEVAEAWCRRSLEVRERVAPESGAVAESLSLLGRLRLGQEAPDAELDILRALRIREIVLPDGPAEALDRSALAKALLLRADYGGAAEQVRRALSILQRAAPLSAEMGHALFTAGNLAQDTGDLAGAERYFRDSMQVYQKLFPNGSPVALVLGALSVVAWDRRDFATAESRAREALAIEQRTVPGTASESWTVHHLGDIAMDSGDPATAVTHFRHSLELNEALADGRHVASDLRCLSLALVRLGRLDEAQEHALRSADMRRHQQPNTIHMARSLEVLGEIATLQGRYAAAEEHYQEAVRIAAPLVAGTREEAHAHYGLGRARRAAGRLTEAAQSFAFATAALDRQHGRLGGSEESPGDFSAAYSRYYQDEIETLVELGRARDAFHVLERSRARALLTMLAGRTVAFSVDLPAEIAQARQNNQAAYGRIQADLAALDPEKDRAEVERLLGRLRELRIESAEIQEKVRAASPRLAALHDPEPLDVAAASSALDPDEVLISFAVGEKKTLVFVLERGTTPDEGLSVFTIPMTEEALRQEVESFRHAIERGDEIGLVRAQAARLYDLLLRPADATLARAHRAAVSPDGPLHLLPFGALLRGEPGERPARWLADCLPMHVVASATQYAELKKTRHEVTPEKMRLVAFGDPRTSSLDPLPYSRREVEAITGIFGTQAVAYLGDEATESRVKSGLRDVSYLHFACHGVLDEGFPLHSALALSAPATSNDGEEENGLLQVWEIFDSVRVDADLVTLSGCNTALGRKMGGEGLMGLTRAFQFAGARTVMSSLWAVGDESTAELMSRFYRHVKAGQTKADALRAAQVELIRGEATYARNDSGTRGIASRVHVAGLDMTHPLRWASFQLVGDWR